MGSIDDLVGCHRAQLGRKPDHATAERAAEARRLTSLFGGQRGFSFLRLGDLDVAYLLNAFELNSVDLFPSDHVVNGAAAMGSPGLDNIQAPRLRAALERSDYLDFHECLWKNSTILDRLALCRASGTTRNPTRETSYILPAWVEYEFRLYCRGRRLLFCGAEAPMLEELLKSLEFRQASAAFWPENCEAYFLRPRENGRNLARNLDAIKHDLKMAISRWNIDTLFLSLGAGAKILCYELAREHAICAMDFGSLMRSLTYSGSDGNRTNRSTHTIFLFHVPFGSYMDVLEKVFPDLKPEERLAKAHAQLLLEVQRKELGWSHSAWEYDLGAVNRAVFQEAFKVYRARYHSIFDVNPETRQERAGFLHLCGVQGLTMQGRMFLLVFRVKGWFRSLVKRILG